jgi:hypothetical protein
VVTAAASAGSVWAALSGHSISSTEKLSEL